MKTIVKISDAMTLAACSAVAFYCGSHGLLDGDVVTVGAAISAVFASATAHA